MVNFISDRVSLKEEIVRLKDKARRSDEEAR